jgi:hypothetical protein
MCLEEWKANAEVKETLSTCEGVQLLAVNLEKAHDASVEALRGAHASACQAFQNTKVATRTLLEMFCAREKEEIEELEDKQRRLEAKLATRRARSKSLQDLLFGWS